MHMLRISNRAVIIKLIKCFHFCSVSPNQTLSHIIDTSWIQLSPIRTDSKCILFFPDGKCISSCTTRWDESQDWSSEFLLKKQNTQKNPHTNKLRKITGNSLLQLCILSLQWQEGFCSSRKCFQKEAQTFSMFLSVRTEITNKKNIYDFWGRIWAYTYMLRTISWGICVLLTLHFYLYFTQKCIQLFVANLCYVEIYVSFITDLETQCRIDYINSQEMFSYLRAYKIHTYCFMTLQCRGFKIQDDLSHDTLAWLLTNSLNSRKQI